MPCTYDFVIADIFEMSAIFFIRFNKPDYIVSEIK